MNFTRTVEGRMGSIIGVRSVGTNTIWRIKRNIEGENQHPRLVLHKHFVESNTRRGIPEGPINKKRSGRIEIRRKFVP